MTNEEAVIKLLVWKLKYAGFDARYLLDKSGLSAEQYLLLERLVPQFLEEASMNRNEWIGKAMKDAHVALDLEEETNIIDLEAARKAQVTGPLPAGKGPEVDNWLGRQEEGTFFLVARRDDIAPMEAAEVQVYRKIPDWSLLWFHMPTHSFPMWLNHTEYSKAYKLLAVVRQP